MTPDDLKQRTRSFSINVIRFVKRFIAKDDITNEIAKQLAEAAGAAGAAYRAACRARSRADFIYKLGNAIEEADESAFWLEVMAEAELAPRHLVHPLWKEADELTRILVRSQETSRRNR
jgi:four helix bundle protein